MTNANSNSSAYMRAQIIHYTAMIAVLFLFWLILSGRMELRYILIGFFTAVAVAVATKPIMVFTPEETGYRWLSLWDLPWLRIAVYFPWLLGQIVVANIQMALIILHPKLPIDPHLVEFQKHIPHPVGRFVLANSITLTPGTITLDQEADRYQIHLVQTSFLDGVVAEKGEGKMPAHVGAVFGVPEKTQTSEQSTKEH